MLPESCCTKAVTTDLLSGWTAIDETSLWFQSGQSRASGRGRVRTTEFGQYLRLPNYKANPKSAEKNCSRPATGRMVPATELGTPHRNQSHPGSSRGRGAFTLRLQATHPTARTVRAVLLPNRQWLRRGPLLWGRVRAG